MNDATQPPGGACDDAETLDLMLGLADRELRFLRNHFGAEREITGTESGVEFLEALDIALLALARVSIERSESDMDSGAHRALQDAIAVMKRDGS